MVRSINSLRERFEAKAMEFAAAPGMVERGNLHVKPQDLKRIVGMQAMNVLMAKAERELTKQRVEFYAGQLRMVGGVGRTKVGLK